MSGTRSGYCDLSLLQNSAVHLPDVNRHSMDSARRFTFAIKQKMRQVEGSTKHLTADLA